MLGVLWKGIVKNCTLKKQTTSNSNNKMMRFLVLSALVACALGDVLAPRHLLPDGRIVGGENTRVEEHKHQVSLRVFGSPICGGSIIGPEHVLTAAHCCTYPASWYSVLSGVTDLKSGKDAINVDQVLIHPGYNSNSLENDACVLKLKAPIEFSDVAQPIELTDKEPEAGTVAVVTGWGAITEGGQSSNIMQAVTVFITPRNVCNDQYYNYGGIADNMICAGVDAGGKDACQGDSGGPLTAYGKLVGIVSWGVGCARRDFSGVYTNVAVVRSWIESVLV